MQTLWILCTGTSQQSEVSERLDGYLSSQSLCAVYLAGPQTHPRNQGQFLWLCAWFQTWCDSTVHCEAIRNTLIVLWNTGMYTCLHTKVTNTTKDCVSLHIGCIWLVWKVWIQKSFGLRFSGEGCSTLNVCVHSANSSIKSNIKSFQKYYQHDYLFKTLISLPGEKNL